ncbi:MAG: N-acetyl-gamma-glutamyl-phosphate reductase [Myxococcota bacterium]
MGRPRVFIDGQAGTTGLRIRSVLAPRRDLELLVPPDERRKDATARRELFEAADLAVLCLPDDAAREVDRWSDGVPTRVLDASSAHRTDESWVFGLPELTPGQRAAIRSAQCVSNPGCYASGMLLALRPLLDAGVLPRDAPLVVHAISGYSGGGRALIERWEDPDRGLLVLPYPAPYALDRVHKHVPEVQRHAGLEGPLLFVPSVGPFRDGMRLEIPLHASLLAGGTTAKALWEVLSSRYREEPFVRVHPLRDPLECDELSFDPRALNGTNRLDITVAASPVGHVLLIVQLDNLGKGAAGVAVQNINLMLGLPETTGLDG